MLVDPGVSAPTGDPDSLLAAASWHENLASHFETTATMLQFTRGSLSGENSSGEAASSYQDLTGLVIGHFSQAAMTASAAAAALRRYGSKLLLLQQEGVAAVKQVVHWMTVRAADQKKLEKAQADVKTAQNAVSGAQSSINSYVPHGGPGAVTAQVNAQAQQLRQAQAALETAQTAERAAQKAVDHDDQQVLAWQTKARLIWHEAQNEAALATGSLEPLEVLPPPLAGAPATFTNTLADDAPFLAANPQLTDPFARIIAAANAKKNHLSGSDENNDVQTILNALNSGKNLNDVKLSVPHHSGGGLFSDILAGIASVGPRSSAGAPRIRPPMRHPSPRSPPSRAPRTPSQPPPRAPTPRTRRSTPTRRPATPVTPPRVARASIAATDAIRSAALPAKAATAPTRRLRACRTTRRDGT